MTEGALLLEETGVQVLRVKNHDEACALWRGMPARSRTLLHLDAHIDFEWVAEKKPADLLKAPSLLDVFVKTTNLHGWSVANPAHQGINLGNYLYQALKEQMFSTWYWVVPDPLWFSKKTKKRLWKELLDLYRFRPAEMDRPVGGTVFQTSFLGVPTWVGPLELLPPIKEPVTLNLDLDYLCTDADTEIPAPQSLHRKLPWIWPEELHERLQRKNIRINSAVISDSVEGGYTPVGLKFMGEIFQALFRDEIVPENYFNLKKAMTLRLQGKLDEAMDQISTFTADHDLETSRHYQKAQILFEMQQVDKARTEFKICAGRDTDFLSKDNNVAYFYETRGRAKEALAEYDRMSQLIGDSVPTLTGRAQCLASLKKFEEARLACQKALEREPQHPEAHVLMGLIELRRRKFSEAVKWLSHAVVLNPKAVMPRIALGESLFRAGRPHEAKNELREALGLGAHFPVTYFLLSQVYLKLGFFAKSRQFFFEALRLFGKDFLERRFAV